MRQQTLDDLITHAVTRVMSEMRRTAPFLAEAVSRWMMELWRTGRPQDYFLQPDRFPFLLLPWWFEESIRGTPDVSFQSDLMYSSVNGYYFIRLADDVMDGSSGAAPTLLPALAVFHSEFQSPYQRWFPADHDFWGQFRTIWHGAANAAAQDAALDDIDGEGFIEVSSRKITAAKIPLMAVAYRYHSLDRLTSWSDFCDRLGRFEQFMDDLFDWHDDLTRGAATWFLAEGRRRALVHETPSAWFVREGFDWGVNTLREWMVGLREAGAALESSDVEEHLIAREARLVERWDQLRPALQSLRVVASDMRSS